MSQPSSSRTRIRFKTDFEKSVLLHNAEKRGWVRSSDPPSLLASQNGGAESDWNFYWGSVSNIRAIFNPENGYRLNDQQVLCTVFQKNHCWYDLT